MTSVMGSRAIVLAAAVWTAWAGVGAAQVQSDLPLFELGLGLAARSTPDYPASEDRSNRIVAFPFIAYRGRFLEIGEDETFRFIPFQTERFEVAISIDGASGVERQGNALRGDLPDLDALAEFGPELIWRAAEVPSIVGDRVDGDRTLGRIELALQTRGVFSLGGGFDGIAYEGFLVRPALRYRQNGAIKPGSRIEATIGPVFATNGVHAYFYDVAPGNGGTPYQSDAGYLGTELTASIRYPLFRRVRIFGGFGLAYLGGAANENSPLFDTDFNASVFAGLTLSLYQTKARGVRDR